MKPLVIAFDAQPSQIKERTGHGFYIDGLLSELRKLAPLTVLACVPSFKQSMSTLRRIWWDQISFPYQARRAHANLLHTTAFSVPLFSRKKKVATVHDIALRHFPENMRGISGWFLGKFVPWTFQFADHLIAVSEATKKDLVKYLGISPKKITVIPLGVSSFYKPSQSEEKEVILQKLGLKEGNFFLCVGTLEPRKNYGFLIEAIAPFLRTNPDFRLVLVGKRGWQYEDIFSSIQKVEVQDQVIEAGYVSDEEKRGLYSSACVLCLPSKYEGFGMPILEACACACPVISANNSSLTEVVGEGGIVLPLESSVWLTEIESMTHKKYREKWVAAAKKRASYFSWERTALATLEVYKKVIESN